MGGSAASSELAWLGLRAASWIVAGATVVTVAVFAGWRAASMVRQDYGST